MTQYTWKQLFPVDIPPNRYGQAIWYDPDLDVVYMHGGQGTSSILHDTWKWDGTDWTELHPVHFPPAATFFKPQFGAVYSPDLGYSLMYGFNSGGFQTWKWDGTDWTLLAPAHQPNGEGFLMVDAANTTILLASTHIFSFTTWLWSGTDWAQQTPAHQPTQWGIEGWIPPGIPYIWDNQVQSENKWDGTNWVDQHSTGLPPADLDVCNASYFGYTGGLVAVNSFNVMSPTPLTAHYDPVANEWTDLAPLVSPANRTADAMTCQNVGGLSVLLFGGKDVNTGLPFEDTWELVPVTPETPGTPYIRAYISTI